MPFLFKTWSATPDGRGAQTEMHPTVAPPAHEQRPLEFAPLLDGLLLEAALCACACSSEKTNE
ncbi:hypothetical protein SAMN06297382_1421 [Amphiplicatus metriothermophilus]|uniref:Uncharacterized protein n=1 Tax=Amphiplicatus metriothermophilus TaxID=1519374 RepID=A0A239PQ21_9PROT|nr:hypothetical protein [Amphiplicatus metriothermophilus]SNT72381.1 hypothetical protein SAMN06297382_1421 [Amphiplicatus metriothermophilus]